MRSTAYKKQGAPDRQFRIQQKLRIFTCVAPHIKSKRLPIDGPLLSKNLCFYMRSTAYKSKGLPIGSPILSKNLGFLHA
jgi:hypothetical protein